MLQQMKMQLENRFITLHVLLIGKKGSARAEGKVNREHTV